MIAAIVGLFTALPQLLSLISSFASWLNTKMTSDPSFLKDVGNAFDQLNSAQTQEERSAAAASIASVIKRM